MTSTGLTVVDAAIVRELLTEPREQPRFLLGALSCVLYAVMRAIAERPQR